MLVALTKGQIEHTVRTMYQHGTVYNNNIHTTTPFSEATSIENATVVRDNEIRSLPGALLLLPPKCARSVVIQYPTHCYDTSINGFKSETILVQEVCHNNLLWAAVDLSRNTSSSDSSIHTTAERELQHVLSNLRYGEVNTSTSTPSAMHDINSVTAGVVNNGDSGTDHVPVNLNSHDSLISTLLNTVPHIAVRAHLYQGSAATELLPHIKDAHLGDLYSLRVCQFYDLSVLISRCDLKNTSSTEDVRVELCVIVVQNEVPVLSQDNDDKQKLQSSTSAMATSMRPCVITGKPYCSYVLRSPRVQTDSGKISNEAANSICSGSVVHKLRLCFAYSGSYSVFPLVRVTPLGSSSSHTNGDGISMESSCVGGSWWTATSSYMRVVAK